MLIKVSLRHYSPSYIYDYVFRHMGKLGMKIKKKHVIIGFKTFSLEINLSISINLLILKVKAGI